MLAWFGSRWLVRFLALGVDMMTSLSQWSSMCLIRMGWELTRSLSTALLAALLPHAWSMSRQPRTQMLGPGPDSLALF